MGIAQAGKGDGGVDTTPPYKPTLNDMLMHHIKIEGLGNVAIGKQIPYCEGLKMRTLLNVLIAISVFNHPTLRHIYISLGYYHDSTTRAVKHLVKCGLVREVGKPRLIKPFQRYKVERGFAITIKGSQALRNLLSV